MEKNIARLVAYTGLLLLLLPSSQLSARPATKDGDGSEVEESVGGSSEDPGSPSDGDPNDVEDLPLPTLETVVTADRSEERAFESTRAVEVVSREDASKTVPSSVPEAMEDVTGLHLQQTNRGAGAPILRGRVGPDNLILVDGVRFNTSMFRTGPNQYLATVDLHALDRMELVRGPSSVLYGNGALGGVMHLITKEPEVGHGPLEWGGSASAHLATADRSLGAAADIEGSLGPVGVLGSASLGTFGELRAGRGFTQPYTDYDRGGWLAKAVYEPAVDWSVTGAYLGSHVRDAGRTDRLGSGEILFYDNTDHLAYVSAGWRGHGMIREVKGTLSYHHLLESIDRFVCDSDAVFDQCLSLGEEVLAERRRGRDSVGSVGFDVSTRLELLERRLTMLVGADVYRDHVASRGEVAFSDSGFVFEPTERGSFSTGSTYLTAGTFVHGRAALHDAGPGAPKLRAQAGARLSAFAGSAPDVPDVGDVDYGYAGLVGSAGLQYYQPGRFNLYASFVQGFRAPNLQETTVVGITSSKFEVPNADLRPERSDTFELGAKAIMGRGALEAVVFRSYIADAMDEEPSLWNGETSFYGYPVVRRVNAAEGVYDGIELAGSLSVWLLELSADVTWIRGELTSAAGEAHPARRVPPVFGSVTGKYSAPAAPYFVELGARWAGRQSRLHPSDEADPRICGIGEYRLVMDQSCEGTPGFLVLDARAGMELNDWSRLTLVAANLTDRRYRTHGSGFYSPGFGLRAMVEVSY